MSRIFCCFSARSASCFCVSASFLFVRSSDARGLRDVPDNERSRALVGAASNLFTTESTGESSLRAAELRAP